MLAQSGTAQYSLKPSQYPVNFIYICNHYSITQTFISNPIIKRALLSLYKYVTIATMV